MKNTIDQMSKILEKHNIYLHEGVRKDESGDKTKDHERFHALKAGFSKSHAFHIDLGASNHMVSLKESLSYLDITGGTRIHMEDDSQIPTVGKV